MFKMKVLVQAKQERSIGKWAEEKFTIREKRKNVKGKENRESSRVEVIFAWSLDGSALEKKTALKTNTVLNSERYKSPVACDL